MTFSWLNRVNMVETGGPFKSVAAATLHCAKFYATLGDDALDVAILSKVIGKRARVIKQGHVKDGVWHFGYPFDQDDTWVPMDDKIILAAIGKLGEEVSECAKAIFRAIIQGLDERDPKTQQTNIAALQDEIADVRGLTDLVANLLDMPADEIAERATMKRHHKEQWLGMLMRAGYGKSPPNARKGTRRAR
jgi:NTP pyrophosphatase (non-canonical NTP hydrolase)